jgi:protein-tyrosine phosphatase
VSDIDKLASLGIRSILTMTQTPITHYAGIDGALKKHNIDVYQCPTKDHFPPDNKGALKAIEYIANAEKPIYIHCRGGIGRSGIITIAYLVLKRGMGLEQAREFVSKRRNYQGNAHASAQGHQQRDWVEGFIKDWKNPGKTSRKPSLTDGTLVDEWH